MDKEPVTRLRGELEPQCVKQGQGGQYPRKFGRQNRSIGGLEWKAPCGERLRIAKVLRMIFLG